MNDLENLLRSWTPRRPSAKLERRLFADEPARAAAADTATVAVSRSAPQTIYRWLAPATAALLFISILWNQRGAPQVSFAQASSPLVTSALSNQSLAAWLPGSFAREQNGVRGENLDWTNGRPWPSSTRSLSGSRGND